MRPSVRKFFARKGFKYIQSNTELIEYMVRKDGFQVKVISKAKAHPCVFLDQYGHVVDRFDEFNAETLNNYLNK